MRSVSRKNCLSFQSLNHIQFSIKWQNIHKHIFIHKTGLVNLWETTILEKSTVMKRSSGASTSCSSPGEESYTGGLVVFT
ncbi:hypothetical protein HAX54_014467 [Datura stramonium]|uniref:Uncharacterized protein n=1 Tax=Datura stramonium TaxID=4076 RepID=A0ABS8RKA0_DATST|nr:hypothetical protein [Datura stramonium]